MQITPIEIRQKKFEKKFRGYHTDEVDAFLHSLAFAWEKLIAQFNELKITLEDHKKEISRLQDLENALLKTMNSAELTANSTLEQAKKEAELIIKSAEVESKTLLQEAEKQAQAIEEASKYQAEQRANHIERELAETKQVIQLVEAYKDSLLQQLQQLAEELLVKTQNFQNRAQSTVLEINSQESTGDTE